MKRDILSNVIAWAQAQSKIKAVLLTGSRAQKKKVDAFSDYDVSIFCSARSFLKEDAWLSHFGKVWICLPEKVRFKRQTFPSRLVIFEKGIKVDFIFYSMDILKSLVKSEVLPEEFDMGYQVLLDKEGITKNLTKAGFHGFKIQSPSEKEFIQLVEEFFFEVYHVFKYLKRGDLWSAKLRDADLKFRLLYKMIEWNERAKHHWDNTTLPSGKNMHSWVDKGTWQDLHGSFAHFEVADSEKALDATIALFRKLAKETAELLEYYYPSDVDKNICKYINNK